MTLSKDMVSFLASLPESVPTDQDLLDMEKAFLPSDSSKSA